MGCEKLKRCNKKPNIFFVSDVKAHNGEKWIEAKTRFIQKFLPGAIIISTEKASCFPFVLPTGFGVSVYTRAEKWIYLDAKR